MITGTTESCQEVMDVWSEMVEKEEDVLVMNLDVVLKYVSWKLVVRPVPVIITMIYAFLGDLFTMLITKKYVRVI